MVKDKLSPLYSSPLLWKREIKGVRVINDLKHIRLIYYEAELKYQALELVPGIFVSGS